MNVTILKAGRQVGRAGQVEVFCGEKGFDIFPHQSPDVRNGAKKTLLGSTPSNPLKGPSILLLDYEKGIFAYLGS